MSDNIENKMLCMVEGCVVSNKMDKMVIVLVECLVKYVLYGKYIKCLIKLYVYDVDNVCNEGDVVCVIEIVLMFKIKNWCVVEVIMCVVE